jgi:hypothetical protein
LFKSRVIIILHNLSILLILWKLKMGVYTSYPS